MATNWTAWYTEVRPKAPQAPAAVCLLEIRNAAIEFCRQSLAFQYDFSPIAIVASQAAYALAAPAGSKIEKLLEVQYNDEVIDPISRSDAEKLYGTEWETKEGTPEAYMSLDGTSVTLIPMPAAALADGLKVRVALVPAHDSTSITDDALATLYRDAITKGALSRLLLSPSKPYTNFDLGRKYELDFAQACSVAHVRVHKGRTARRSRSLTFYGR